MAKSLKKETYPSVKDTKDVEGLVKDIYRTLKENIEGIELGEGKKLEDFKAETKEDFLKVNKMFKDMFREINVDTIAGITHLRKRIESLEKSLEDTTSTADGAESLAGDVELDLEALTTRVVSLEAKE